MCNKSSLLDEDETSESFKSGDSDNWIKFATEVDFRFIGSCVLVVNAYNN